MKRKIKILVSIIIFSIIIAAATFGFQLYQPTSLQWLNNSNINSGDVVNIYFTINNNLPSLINSDEDDIISEIINSAKMWSMFSSKANININYNGIIDRSQQNSYDDIINNNQNDDNTEESKIIKPNVNNMIFASNEEDPDCTSVACSYVWNKADSGNIAYFDIKLNLADNNLQTNEIDNTVYDIQTVVSHHLGHVIGLSHCMMGDTVDQCSSKLSGNMSNPTEDSIMYKQIIPGQEKIVMSHDDANGVIALYGQLSSDKQAIVDEMTNFKNKVESGCPCLLPENETEIKYILTTEEQQSIDAYYSHLNEENINTNESRKNQALLTQSLYITAYSSVGIPAERYLIQALSKMSDYSRISTEHLGITRNVLVRKIKENNIIRQDYKNDLDPMYYEFMTYELKALIQIRKSIIDELINRG